MKRILIEALAVAAVVATVNLLAGCATVGNGQLDLDTGTLAEAAVAGASGDYVKAVAKIATLIEKRKQATIELDEAMKAAGFTPSLTMYFDGAVIEDHKRFSKEERWSKLTVGENSVTSPAEVEDEKWIDDILGAAEGVDLGSVLVSE